MRRAGFRTFVPRHSAASRGFGIHGWRRDAPSVGREDGPDRLTPMEGETAFRPSDIAAPAEDQRERDVVAGRVVDGGVPPSARARVLAEVHVPRLVVGFSMVRMRRRSMRPCPPTRSSPKVPVASRSRSMVPGIPNVSGAFAFTVMSRSAPWIPTMPRAVSPVVCSASTVITRPSTGTTPAVPAPPPFLHPRR